MKTQTFAGKIVKQLKIVVICVQNRKDLSLKKLSKSGPFLYVK
jgi:hypothetical protein